MFHWPARDQQLGNNSFPLFRCELLPTTTVNGGDKACPICTCKSLCHRGFVTCHVCGVDFNWVKTGTKLVVILKCLHELFTYLKHVF